MTPAEARKHYEKIIELASLKNRVNIILGEELYALKKGKNFVKAVGVDTTWKQFLADPKIAMADTTTRRYIAIYEKYIVELGMDMDEIMHLDSWKLEFAAQRINQRNRKVWLDRIKNLSRSDLIASTR